MNLRRDWYFLQVGALDPRAQRLPLPDDLMGRLLEFVVAHEVGHHVQNLMGVMDKFDQQLQRADPRTRNALSMRLELQADCFAGVWAYHQQEKQAFLDPGDVDAALRTAAAIGDDTLQRRAQGRVVPDSFTHGSAEQRQHWFNTGLKQGTVAACNTFAATQL